MIIVLPSIKQGQMLLFVCHAPFLYFFLYQYTALKFIPKAISIAHRNEANRDGKEIFRIRDNSKESREVKKERGTNICFLKIYDFKKFGHANISFAWCKL